MSEKELSHLDKEGRARMVNVGHKPSTRRIAIAKGEVHMKTQTLDLILGGQMKKGDVFTTAKIAGIMGAKGTSDLIPLCHPLELSDVAIDITPNPQLPGVEITCKVESFGKTGVEMEALTAVSITALTIYDMAKAVDKSMHLQNIRLIEKHGGQSGDIVNE